MEKAKHFVKFVLKSRFVFILVSVLILGLLLWDYHNNWNFMDDIKNKWNNEIDPVVGFATLLVAFSVWINETISSWKNSLPKKLTVIFIFEGKEVMRCNYAHLDHEADIRNLGQQIGRQMNKTKLDFYAPKIKRERGHICTEKQEVFMHYKVEFTLTEWPKNLNKKECMIWEPPFDAPPKTIPCQKADKT